MLNTLGLLCLAYFFFITEKVTEEKSNTVLAAYGKGGKEKNLSIFVLLISRKHADNTVISTVLF